MASDDSGNGAASEGMFEQDSQELFAAFVSKLKDDLDAAETGMVLVVDDSPLMRNLVGEFIKRAAPLVKIVTSEHGKDALGKLEWIRHTTGGDPLLIITDLDMPEMDGWTFIEELYKQYKAAGKDQGIPVIVLSSTDGEKRSLFSRKSVSGSRRAYRPLAAVAKATCMNPANYDAMGDKGLAAWIEYFLQHD